MSLDVSKDQSDDNKKISTLERVRKCKRLKDRGGYRMHDIDADRNMYPSEGIQFNRGLSFEV